MDVASTASNPFAALGLTREQPQKGTQELGQQDFLELMLAQVRNQDPLKPQANGEFLGQMAQFSMVDGIQQLNTGYDVLGSRLAGEQTLAAANLLGRDVLVPAIARTSGDGLQGIVELEGPASEVRVDILNSAGETVRSLSVDGSRGGDVAFTWDGRDSKGDLLPAAEYRVAARTVDNGRNTQLPTYLSAPVTAVTRDGATVQLELDGLPPASMSDIRRIA
ncbi:MAG: flagellar hook assembly protein FlgD [Algiphilus sp.]